MTTQKSLFPVPKGATANVKIIDSTSRITMLPSEVLLKPPLKTMKYMPEIPTWSFLVENSDGRKVLFDLGIPTDWHNLAPKVSDRLKKSGWDIQVEKSTGQVLTEHDISLEGIEAIVWSHWHWDHIGNPETFPSSTDLIVGPGFKKEMLPAYPEKEDSNVRESDFKGRTLREITFEEESGTLQLGQLRAFDYFGDGSFYLLDTPGHAIGHLGGLARTTSNPDTFVFMGGDLCHHQCEIRPSKHESIPTEIPHAVFNVPCPGSVFETLLENRGRAKDEPFADPAFGSPIEEAIRTIRKTQDADADQNILFIYAHDSYIKDVVDMFPKSANGWKEAGWREKVRWTFLRDLKDEAESQEGKASL